MYEVSAAFKAALADEGSQHHIKGLITDKNGTQTEIQDEIADNSIRIERQCTADADTFAFAQIYTGTVQLEILGTTQLRRDDLRGGTVKLWFGINDLEEWVLLGTWEITDPQRGNQDSIIINGVDGTAKLDVPVPYDDVGRIKMKRHMEVVTELTGLEFAQTIEELSTIAGKNLDTNAVFGQAFCPTCRAEVNAIAQYIGGIAYIDREGKIAFRKFGDNSEGLNIPATKRFKIDLAEYNIRVAALSYKHRNELIETTQASGTHANTDLEFNITGAQYIWQSQREDILDELERIRDNLADCGIWVPGTFDFYGDPTIDLGDLVTVSGGINGENGSCAFLVTGFNWQFRGPMTLISAGAAEAVGNVSSSSGSGGSSSSVGGGGQTVAQKPWEMVDLEGFPQTLTVRWREIGAAIFAVADETLVIAHLTVNLIGTDIGEVVVHVLLNGVMQTEYSWDTIANGQKLTTELNVPLTVEGGVHRLTIEAKGAATVDRIVASVYGQGVSEYTGEPTFESEYRYHADTVDEYIGSSLTPRIPAQLSGTDIHVIGGGSFAGSDVEYTYIPDGVEEIK